MPVLLICCTIILIVCAIKWIFRNKVLYNFADQIPGPRAFAVIGSAHKFVNKNEEDRFRIVRDILEKYQEHNLVKMWLGPALFVFVNDPVLIKQVLNSPKCFERSIFYKFLKLNKGLLASKCDMWKGHRKGIEDCFSVHAVKSFHQVSIDSADQMIANLDGLEDKTKVDIYATISKCSLRSSLATTFGLDSEEVNLSDELLKAVEQLTKIVSYRCNDPILYVDFLYRFTRSNYREKKYRKRCHNYLEQVLTERRKQFALTNNNSNGPSCNQRDEELGHFTDGPKSFIDYLILSDEKFSDEEIHDHLFTFVSAGYETTALQTTFTLLLLAMHQEVQDKVYQEIIQHFPSNEIKVKENELQKLEYMDIVIKESMRLLPPVPLIGRVTLDELELDGRVVPKGVNLLVNIFNIHHRKDIWGPDAETFRPERFLYENESQSQSFLSFSDGPRNCIGRNFATQAIKVTLIAFLRKYKVTTDLKYDELKFKADLTLKVTQKLIVSLETRN